MNIAITGRVSHCSDRRTGRAKAQRMVLGFTEKGSGRLSLASAGAMLALLSRCFMHPYFAAQAKWYGLQGSRQLAPAKRPRALERHIIGLRHFTS